MKFTTTTTTLISTLFAQVIAQDISLLPACAQTCFLPSTSVTTCAITDYACLCGDATYFSTVQVCVLGGCSIDNTITTLNWATDTCNAAGVPLKHKRQILGRKH
ncbi:hypothetical protein BJ875DRAFT_133293 [Amylocarpus encephaloides]|uniref:CFEM domain-containing protein n=1 Tax=Amylocarpus encephaloides TaxID=45428 RepID=A0A9P8C3J3_9HELO|nr:hypothetical protein BJ875DRAFT_133293 [Amylocarpus encephaloides]